MKLLTKELETKLIKAHEAAEAALRKEEETEAIVLGKFFNPCGGATWYLTEYDPENRVYFAFANLGDYTLAECGWVGRDELEALKCPPFGLPIERDLYFKPVPLAEVIKIVKAGGHV